MIKKYLAKKAAKKSASWMARTQAKVLFTAVATIATHKLLKKTARKFPAMSFLEPKKT